MTDPRTSHYLSRLHVGRLQVIATQHLAEMTWSGWQPSEGAPLTIDQARRLYDKGLIEMTQRRVGPGMFEQMVVRRKQVDGGRVPWFTRPDYLSGRGPDSQAIHARRRG